MKQLFALVLAVAGSAASAQTPTTNPMPDGSRDMYAGLGVVSAPRYEGADSRKVSALPVLQVQWSNGFFISGVSAGMHLSSRPTVEYGPLLSVHASRDESGSGGSADGVRNNWSLQPVFVADAMRAKNDNRLVGMGTIGARLQGGGFLNVFVAPQWRLTSSLLYGAGEDHEGALLQLGLQRLATEIAPHHALSFSINATLVNRAYNQSYFGVSIDQSAASGNRIYVPDGGLKDVRLSARWTWALSPSWMLTTNLHAVRLAGDARRSPLVERPNNVTVSTALAYRF